MRVLAFDTATTATTVALADGDSVQELRDDPPAGARPRHTSRLMPLMAELLAQAGWDWTHVDRLAVGIGPGTFTGLRIGVATARALAQARGLELVGVSTLESLSLNSAGDNVCAVLDARRGEVFAAAWNHRRPLYPAAPFDPSTLAGLLGPDTLAIGDGAVAFRGVFERSGARIPDDGSDLHRVTAINHCRLGLLADPSDPGAVRPEYLRLPDAEIARKP
jgi:tRNA threonylcarbamoyladenosine biosynthesis protein TsaB